jgi:NADPH-dependent curcumin reductase CurA
MRGATIGRVVASKSSKLQTGDLAYGLTGWAEYAVMPEKDVQKVEVPSNGRVTDALGVLGTCNVGES